MKRSEELKIQRQATIDQMQGIVDKAKDNGKARSLTDDEQTKYDELKARAASLKAQIEDAEALEADQTAAAQRSKTTQAPVPAPHIKREKTEVYSVGKAMREFALGGAAGLTGMEKEEHDELSRSIKSNGLLVPYSSRAAAVNNTTTHATSVDVKIDPNLSIRGYEPLWQQMGLTVVEGLTGTLKLGKKTHDVAGKYAEGAEVTAESNIPSFVTASPERFGITDDFSKELLAEINPSVQAAIVADMLKGVDRKLTAEVYTVALAAATETAGGALTEAGLNALMAAVEGNGAFAMDRGSFYAGKAVKFDTGSGIRLLNAVKGQAGKGETWEGVPAFYSNLFADGADQQYVVYGDWSEMWIGFWGGLEIIMDPYTRARYGEIRTTINRLADAIVRNTSAFVKSPDLDVA